MAVKKMSVKDLASEVEKLTELNNKKDDLIKALDEKIIILQTWAQENFSNICKKISENEQLHFKNEKRADRINPPPSNIRIKTPDQKVRLMNFTSMLPLLMKSGEIWVRDFFQFLADRYLNNNKNNK